MGLKWDVLFFWAVHLDNTVLNVALECRVYQGLEWARDRSIEWLGDCVVDKLNVVFIVVSELSEVLPRHFPRRHQLDRFLLLPDGVVGSPGTLHTHTHTLSQTLLSVLFLFLRPFL